MNFGLSETLHGLEVIYEMSFLNQFVVTRVCFVPYKEGKELMSVLRILNSTLPEGD